MDPALLGSTSLLYCSAVRREASVTHLPRAVGKQQNRPLRSADGRCLFQRASVSRKSSVPRFHTPAGGINWSCTRTQKARTRTAHARTHAHAHTQMRAHTEESGVAVATFGHLRRKCAKVGLICFSPKRAYDAMPLRIGEVGVTQIAAQEPGKESSRLKPTPDIKCPSKAKGAWWGGRVQDAGLDGTGALSSNPSLLISGEGKP